MLPSLRFFLKKTWIHIKSFFYINIEFDPLRLLWVVRFPFCTALLEHSQQLLLVVFTLVDAGQQTNKQIDRRRIWNSNVLRFWNSGQMFMIYKSFILKPYTFKEKHLNGTCLEPIMPKKLKINFYVPYFNLSWKKIIQMSYHWIIRWYI